MDTETVKANYQNLPLKTDHVHSLELRYIELLEKRIANLEALVEKVEGPGRTDRFREETKNSKKDDRENGVESVKKEDAEKLSAVDKEISHEPRILFRELKYDSDGDQEEIDISDQEASKIPPDPISEHVDGNASTHSLTWTRAHDKFDKYHHSLARIECLELQALLHLVLEHRRDFHYADDDLGDSIILDSPFEPLIHNWEILTGLASGEDNNEHVKRLASRLNCAAPRTDIEMEESPHLKSLRILADKARLEKATRYLVRLLALVKRAPELASYFESFEKLVRPHSIEYKNLWALFPPGELVYSSVFMEKPQIFVVYEHLGERTVGSEGGRDEKMIWRLLCWSYDWDGTVFNRVPIVLNFEEFASSKVINTLPHYPLRYHTKIDSITKMLVKRGKRFRHLCVQLPGSQMFDYDGKAIVHGAGFQKFGGRLDRQPEIEDMDFFGKRMLRTRRTPFIPKKSTVKTQLIKGRIMVDFTSYLQHGPQTYHRTGPMGDAELSHMDEECHCNACMINKALQINQRSIYDNFSRNDEFIDEIQYLICPPRVLGYHLNSRTWLELDISERNSKSRPPERASLADIDDTVVESRPDYYLSEILKPKSRKAFDKLQLRKNQKDLIRDLVESHASGTGKKPLMEDIMEDKGKGLVILLHGPPGVGKTLTAESVAQLAGKPLFSVSVTDIGLDAEAVEHNLEALFELAARWRAVLLFDEADVFLESRGATTSDLRRNSVVAVLLRVLEYYEGILILTTNRISHFDVAVQSRVNLGIRYKDLSTGQKENIFNNFIDQLNDENVQSKTELKKWFREETTTELFEQLNGRQLRNVLFSAASLATNEKEGILKISHISKMADATEDFQKSVQSLLDEARKTAEVGFTKRQ